MFHVHGDSPTAINLLVRRLFADGVACVKLFCVNVIIVGLVLKEASHHPISTSSRTKFQTISIKALQHAHTHTHADSLHMPENVANFVALMYSHGRVNK